MRSHIQVDPDVARVAALVGDPSRAAILMALADGRALPAGELARHASISPQTASAHLDKLFRAHLIAVEVQGRHHYYRLRNAEVARMLESLSIVAPPPRVPVQTDSAKELRFARICYDHLAGRLGVALTCALCERYCFCDGDAGYTLTDKGQSWFHGLGIDVNELRAGRRPLTRRCLDWSERRSHLAGALGAALARRLLELKWIARVHGSRAVRLTQRGEAELGARLTLSF
jgi:DNA-binding transcriptional ArsR family regulator